MEGLMSGTKAYFSANSFQLDNFYFSTQSSKIATLWFDDIIIQTIPGLNESKEILKEEIEDFGLIKELSHDTIQELNKVIIPLNNYLDTWKYYFYSPEKTEDKRLLLATKQIVDDKLQHEYNFGLPGDDLFAMSGIISGIETWTELRKSQDVFLIPNLGEKLVLEKMFKCSFQDQGYELFSNIINFKIPDIDEFSWDKVIELRNHHYLKSFRLKMKSLNDFLNQNDSKVVGEIIEEISRKDMIEFVKLLKPAPIKSSINGIASNIPLPIPNPYALYLSAKDIKNQIDFSKKYGWLYFYLDL
jgi:hypothetical protein